MQWRITLQSDCFIPNVLHLLRHGRKVRKGGVPSAGVLCFSGAGGVPSAGVLCFSGAGGVPSAGVLCFSGTGGVPSADTLCTGRQWDENHKEEAPPPGQAPAGGRGGPVDAALAPSRIRVVNLNCSCRPRPPEAFAITCILYWTCNICILCVLVYSKCSVKVTLTTCYCQTFLRTYRFARLTRVGQPHIGFLVDQEHSFISAPSFCATTCGICFCLLSFLDLL